VEYLAGIQETRELGLRDCGQKMHGRLMNKPESAVIIKHITGKQKII
jgi:hypothetical protein